MSEFPQPIEELEQEWKDSIKVGVKDALENYALIFSISPSEEYPGGPIDFSPISITNSDEVTYDERGFDELSSEEQKFIQGEVFEGLGFDPLSSTLLQSYEFQSPDTSGIVNVHIYATSRSDEGLFMHEVTYPVGKKEYIVAPEEYRL